MIYIYIADLNSKRTFKNECKLHLYIMNELKASNLFNSIIMQKYGIKDFQSKYVKNTIVRGKMNINT